MPLKNQTLKLQRKAKERKEIKNLLIYSIYLANLLLVAARRPMAQMERTNRILSSIFTSSKFLRTKSSLGIRSNIPIQNKHLKLSEQLTDSLDTKGTIHTISNVDDFWAYLKNSFIPIIYRSNEWYNGKGILPFTGQHCRILLNKQNLIIGDIRIRQLRARNESCGHLEEESLQRELSLGCFGRFDEKLMSKSKFTTTDNSNKKVRTESIIPIDISKAFEYSQPQTRSHSWYDLRLPSYFQGVFGNYPSSGGYTILLEACDRPMAREKVFKKIDYLQKHRWIDPATRFVAIEFVTYNSNLEIHSFIRLAFEFPHIGGITKTVQVKSAVLIHSLENTFLIGCEAFLLLFLIYIILCQLIAFATGGILMYLRSFWNLLTTILSIAAVPCIYSYFYLMEFQDQLSHDELWEMQSFHELREKLLGFIVFLSTLRLLKYVSFNVVLAEVQKTLGECYKDLIGFSFMFIAVMMAFALTFVEVNLKVIFRRRKRFV